MYNPVTVPKNWQNPNIKSISVRDNDGRLGIIAGFIVLVVVGALSFAAYSDFHNENEYKKATQQNPNILLHRPPSSVNADTSKRIELASQMFEDLHEAMDKLNPETNVEKIEKIQNEIKRLTEILAALQLERKNE